MIINLKIILAYIINDVVKNIKDIFNINVAFDVEVNDAINTIILILILIIINKIK